MAEFWKYSSRTQPGRKMVEQTRDRREKILTLFAAHEPIEQIAVLCDCDVTTVQKHLRLARREGDPRAKRVKGDDNAD